MDGTRGPPRLRAQGRRAGRSVCGHSGQDQNCVEVAELPYGAAIRDSKHPTAGHIPFSSSEWDAFLTTARAPQS